MMSSLYEEGALLLSKVWWHDGHTWTWGGGKKNYYRRLYSLLPPGEHHAKVEEHSVGAPQCPDGQEHHTSVHVGLLIINPTITEVYIGGQFTTNLSLSTFLCRAWTRRMFPARPWRCRWWSIGGASRWRRWGWAGPSGRASSRSWRTGPPRSSSQAPTGSSPYPTWRGVNLLK